MAPVPAPALVTSESKAPAPSKNVSSSSPAFAADTLTLVASFSKEASVIFLEVDGIFEIFFILPWDSRTFSPGNCGIARPRVDTRREI